MNERVLSIVEAVLRRSSPERPADMLLRAELKRQSGLPAELSRRAAEAVFAYSRWLGWLEADTPESALRQRVPQALSLQTRFESAPDSFPAEELLTRAVPGWVSGHMTVTQAWVRSLQTKPRLWLRARPGRRQELAGRLGDCVVPGFPGLTTTLEYVGGQDLFRTPEFHNGEFELQDVSSQVVGVVCAPQPGETWWDACAGEGGKLLHLSDLMANKGLIWASDRAQWRLRQLKLRTARARAFNYRAVPWQGGAQLPTKTKFDGILVDAPCSGLGTWQRNPHARWTTTERDVLELATVQKSLLRHAAKALKPDGRLIYAVCTLTREETTEVAQDLNGAGLGLKPMLLSNPLRAHTPAAEHLWLGPEEGGNGMFIAAWRAAR